MKKKTIAHYEIERRLGAGGSGVVYAANDTLLQRPVVLKMLHTGLLTAEQIRTTVLREARLASAIEHPNVCAIYEVGESGEEAYIAMQFVPGQPLDKLIERGPASLQLVLSVGIQIADGLQAAHALGIFHRDLKPRPGQNSAFTLALEPSRPKAVGRMGADDQTDRQNRGLPGEIGARSSVPPPSLFEILEEVERRIIVDMLERTNWNQTEAAERFQIPLSTLNQKIKRLGIETRRRTGPARAHSYGEEDAAEYSTGK